jgi:hypothetical protein
MHHSDFLFEGQLGQQAARDAVDLSVGQMLAGFEPPECRWLLALLCSCSSGLSFGDNLTCQDPFPLA